MSKSFQHSDVIHTCVHCHRIILKETELPWQSALNPFQSEHDYLIRNYMVPLPHTKAEARQAAADGCPLFNLYTEAFRDATTPMLRQIWAHFLAIMAGPWHNRRDAVLDSQPDRILLLGDPWRRLPVPLWKHWRNAKTNSQKAKAVVSTYLNIARYMTHHLKRKHLYIILSGNEIRIHYLAWLEIILSLSGQPNTSSGFTPNSSFNPQVGNEVGLKLAKDWLHDCCMNHEACRVMPTSFVPSRLIEINLDSPTTSLHILQTSKDQTPLEWCALSYVWGGDQPMKATKATLKALCNGIQWTELPQTIQDAVTVCATLRIRYLWVDSLCIIQDHWDDMVRELSSMPKIYRHAHCTISAASSQSVHEGFLQNRGYYYRFIQPFALRYEDLHGRERPPVIVSHSKDIDELPDPIEDRGWTYQERRLSPRLLVYSTQRLKWLCATSAQYDGRSDKREPSILDTTNACLPGGKLDHWERIVMDYADRKLTQPSDKLVAIAAIAELYQTELQKTYLAGLWKEDFPLCLCWLAGAYELPARPEHYRAPSWSWAAVDSKIRFWRFGTRHEESFVPDPVLELREAYVAPVETTLPLSAVSSGRILVHGRIKTVPYRYEEDILTLRGDAGEHKLDIFRDSFEPWWIESNMLSKDITVLAIGAFYDPSTRKQVVSFSHNQVKYDQSPMESKLYCGGLLLASTGSGSYKRIGFFECAGHTWSEGCEQYYSEFHEDTITIV